MSGDVMGDRTAGGPPAGAARSGGVVGRWAWVPALGIGVVLYELVRRAVVDTGNPNLVPSLILLGAAVVPVAFIAFVAGRRLVFTVTSGLVAAVALLGGVVGVVTAGMLEYHVLRDLGGIPAVLVAAIEESAKLIVPVAVLLVLLVQRHRLRVGDGLLLGVASGAGFAVLETMGYGLVVLIRSRGDLSVLDEVLVERGLLSPAAHMAWTGLAAAAIWAAVASSWAWRPVLRLVVTVAVVVALHATWDGVEHTRSFVALAVVSLGLLAGTTHRLASPRRGARGGAAPTVVRAAG